VIEFLNSFGPTSLRRKFYIVCGQCPEEEHDIDLDPGNFIERRPVTPADVNALHGIRYFCLFRFRTHSDNMDVVPGVLALKEAVNDAHQGIWTIQAVFPPSPENLVHAVMGLEFRGRQIVTDLMWEHRQDQLVSVEEAEMLRRAVC